MRPDDDAEAPVRVEVLVLSARGGELHYDARSGPVTGGRHPDQVAAALAVPPADVPPAQAPAGQGGARGDGPQPDRAPPSLAMLHSTSWRFAGGQVVLTYAAVLDGEPGAAASRLSRHGIAQSADPRVPSPPHVCPDAVASHAARHLAWLREHDDVAGAALAAMPSLWHALDRHAPAPAGAAPVTADLAGAGSAG